MEAAMGKRICGQCGSPAWLACAPGTAANATIYPPRKRHPRAAPEPDAIVVIAPSRTWCQPCWLLWRAAAGQAHTTAAVGAP
jgi:hypothetical protein